MKMLNICRRPGGRVRATSSPLKKRLGRRLALPELEKAPVSWEGERPREPEIGRKAFFNRSASGFTLVEVMVSAVVLVIFTIAFLGSAIASMRSQQLSCNYYKAMTLARNRLQRASEFAYSSVLLMKEDQVKVDDQGNNVISPGPFWGRRTTLVKTNGTPNLLQITVQIYYPDARGNMSVNPAQLSTLRTTSM